MLFFGISLAAQRWSSTAWIRSFPRSLCSTTTSRWCRGSSFACTTSTTTPTTWLMTTSWGRSNARWARWASLVHNFGSSRSLFLLFWNVCSLFACPDCLQQADDSIVATEGQEAGRSRHHHSEWSLVSFMQVTEVIVIRNIDHSCVSWIYPERPDGLFPQFVGFTIW